MDLNSSLDDLGTGAEYWGTIDGDPGYLDIGTKVLSSASRDLSPAFMDRGSIAEGLDTSV